MQITCSGAALTITWTVSRAHRLVRFSKTQPGLTPADLPEERAYVRNQEIWFFHRGEVHAAVELGLLHDFVCLLGDVPQRDEVAVGGRMRHANGMPQTPVVNCVLLWARPGMEAALSAYEDKVLRLVAEHGGRVLQRGTVLPGSQHHGEPPTEVQFLEMPSEASLDAYMNDPRRLAMAAERDAAIARTDLFRIQPVSRPEPGH